MFFLIAGITPKTKIVDQTPRRCPACGLYQAYYQRVDHYFNLFFIPLVRVKKGEPFLFCQRCTKPVDEIHGDSSGQQDPTALLCRHCGQPVNRDFKYCPSCGKKIGN